MTSMTEGATLGPKKRREELVKVEEWGREVLVREMSAFERIELGALQGEARKADKAFDWVSYLASRCICDPGTRKALYTQAEVEDFAQTEEYARVLEKVLNANVLSARAVEELKGE